MGQLTECGRTWCDAARLDIVNRCIAVLLAGDCGHVVDKVGISAVGVGVSSWCRYVVHDARHPDQEQEEDEHHVEHEQRVEGHQLHSVS